MAPLNCLSLLFLFVSLVKSDTSLEPWKSDDILRTKLENKLSNLMASENEVTDVKPEPKPTSNKVTEKPEYPIAFRKEPSCPNFSDVMEDVKTAISHLSNLSSATIGILTDTFNNPNYKCQLSINPLATIKCLLRVFAASYKELSLLWTEASALREDVAKILFEYGQYSTKCNKNWTFGNTLQLMDLFKVVEGYIKDA